MSIKLFRFCTYVISVTASLYLCLVQGSSEERPLSGTREIYTNAIQYATSFQTDPLFLQFFLQFPDKGKQSSEGYNMKNEHMLFKNKCV